jgi:hypothetical protein
VKASLATVAIALLVLGAGCGSDDGGGDDEPSGSASQPTETTGGGGTSTEDLSSYETIADLNADLAAGGVVCDLEYEGLVDDDGNEVSQCTVDGSQVALSIYADPTTVGEIVDAFVPGSSALAYGANWTIDVIPGGEAATATAEAIAEAAGGATAA